ncbi:transposase [Candidatus Bipolaricaulota bacterium]|nr:transposase [Candidatus Bipolaricaulota bacterium]
MARPLRLEYAGALYHLTSRGNAREAVFCDDADRRSFLDTLSDVVARHRWICHAYCLMDNHYHLVVETPEGSLSRGMQLLNGVYTQWFNRRHDRIGHLFQGRFKSILVEKDSYLLELARYVVLNPVRAGLVRVPRDWPWSSYRATAGYIEPPAYLTVDWILAQFDSDWERAVRAYRRFVHQGRGVRVWDELQAGWVLGRPSFVESLRPRLQQKPLTPEYRQRERLAARPSLDELFAGVTDRATRDERIHEAVRVHGYTLTEVGAHVGLLYSTISTIAKKVERRRGKP